MNLDDRRRRQFKRVSGPPSAVARVQLAADRSRAARAAAFQAGRAPLGGVSPGPDEAFAAWVGEVQSLSYPVPLGDVRAMLAGVVAFWAGALPSPASLRLVDTVFDVQLCAFTHAERDSLLAEQPRLLAGLALALANTARVPGDVSLSLRAAWALKSIACTPVCAQRVWADSVLVPRLLALLAAGDSSASGPPSLFLPTVVELLCAAPSVARVHSVVPVLLSLATQTHATDPGLASEALLALSRLVSELCDEEAAMPKLFLDMGLYYTCCTVLTRLPTCADADTVSAAMFVLSELSMLAHVSHVLCDLGIMDLLGQCLARAPCANTQVLWVLSNILDGHLPAVGHFLAKPAFLANVLKLAGAPATDEEGCIALQCARLCVPEVCTWAAAGPEGLAFAQTTVQTFLQAGGVEVLLRALAVRAHLPEDPDTLLTASAVYLAFSVLPYARALFSLPAGL